MWLFHSVLIMLGRKREGKGAGAGSAEAGSAEALCPAGSCKPHMALVPACSLQDVKNRRNPRLVPYALLDERTKRSNKDSLREAVRTLLGHGCHLQAPDQDPAPRAEVSSGTGERFRIFRAEKTYAVKAGRWYFEFEAVTAGDMRVGWSRPGCQPDRELGSDEQAFAFDGLKAQRWHQGSEHYGRPWQAGDVVGCMVDMDEHTAVFTLNGEVLLDDSGSELAFKDFDVRDGVTLDDLYLFLATCTRGPSLDIDVGIAPFGKLLSVTCSAPLSHGPNPSLRCAPTSPGRSDPHLVLPLSVCPPAGAGHEHAD
ncbi:Ryanodine receptor 2 [Tupaia chinensis]|uniref:Ryanodine receptor 2 n=1 Tax=Tupaia chinensis TaxID=246437 RepID=L9KYT8_TUPCH|nr:Ryanodine receptor 2 [Tupaia chinensis]